MSLWQAWTERLTTVGPINFYSETYFSDYFPGYLYILWIIGEIYKVIFGLSFNSSLFEVIIKLVTTIFDLAGAYYIFKIVSKYQKSLAKLSVILYLGNPAIIFNSSVWGQIDGIFIFFLILTLYLLIEKQRRVKSIIYYALAILIKPHSLALLPVIIFRNLEKNPVGTAIKNLVIIPIVLITLSIPFFIYEPILGLFNLAIRASDVYPYNSLFAFNFWSFFGFWEKDSNLIFGLTYRAWGFILYLFFLLLVMVPLLKRAKDNFYFYFSSCLSVFVFFFFLTRMHERYLLPFFALFLIAAAVKRSKKLFVIYVLMSLIHFANLWYVYYYYNFVYLGVGGTDLFYKILNENYKVLSAALFLIFIYLLVNYYRFLFPAFKPKIRLG